MRFQGDDKPFEVKPNLMIALLMTSLNFSLIVVLASAGIYYIPLWFGVDYSLLTDTLSLFFSFETLKMILIYLVGFAAFLVLAGKTLELSSIRLVFLNEGFEYHHDLIIGKKRDIFYSSVTRINYESGLFFGKIIMELTGTDIMAIKLPYIRYPGAMTARIKKRIDDSVSGELYDCMRNEGIEEETAEHLIRVVRSERVNKENLATNIERALDGEKVSKNVFEVLLAQLLKSGRITKTDLAGVMFSMHERGLITKKDIADVLFYLNSV